MITPDFWFRLITELEPHLTLREIAARIGTSAASVCRFKAGEIEPRHSIGEKLIALHRLRACIRIAENEKHEGKPKEAL